jgi:uncharacterized protein
MAGTSLLTLIDDIAALLDDVAVLTKVATKKTAGVLGDDLALNAEQVTGVEPSREIPVIWAVFKGSALNKLILVPAGLGISAVAPWAIMPLLMLGGGFLCFEGFEKVAHKLLHSKGEDEAERAKRLLAVANTEVDLVAFEKDKIKGAIRTDFILSGEIIVISLGVMADYPFLTRALTLSSFAALITIFVYGLVAGIVKIDDVGLMLQKKGAAAAALGKAMLLTAPVLMKTLGIVGTIAMFLVGGGILVHGIPGLEPWLEGVARGATFTGGNFLVTSLGHGITGVIAGGLLVAIVTGIQRMLPKKAEPPPTAPAE